MFAAESIQKMLDSIYDGIMVLDVDSGKYVYANQCACDLYACPREKVKDLNPADLSVINSAEDEAAILQHNEIALKEGKCVFEWLAKRMDGTTFWADVALSHAEIGGRYYFIAVVRDITAKKNIEADRNLTSAQFRAILDSSPDALAIIDDQGSFLDGNKAFLARWNKKPEELIGHSALEILPKNIFYSRMEKISEVIKTKLPVNFTDTYNDSWFEISISPVLEPDGSVKSVAMTSKNITERKISTDKLKMEHHHLVDVLETMSDAFVSIDRNWRYTYVNKKAGYIFNRDAQYLIGKHIWTEFPEGVGQTFHQAYEKSMNEKISIFMEGYYPPYDKWFENRIFPTDEGISVFFHDITERKITESRIAESETKYRFLFEHNPLPMLIYERGSLEIISVNEAFFKLYGYTPEQIARMHLTDLYPEEQKGPITELADRIQGHAYAGEWKHVRADKSMIDILVTSHDLMFDGKHARIAVINDITDRKKIEYGILQSEKSLKLAQHVAHLGNWQHDFDTDTIHWSDEIFSIFELDSDTFKPSYQIFLNLIHPDDREKVDKSYKESIRTKSGYSIEHRLTMADGRIKYVIENCYTEYSNDGSPMRSIGTVQDITERKTIEIELKKSRTLLRSMIDSLPMWIAAIDTEGVYYIANKYYSSTFRKPLDEIENHNFKEFFPPALYRKHRALVDQCFKSKKIVEVSDEVEFEKGKKTFMYGTYTPLFDSEGKLFGMSAAVMDISKQKAIEEEIVQLNQSLEDKVQQRTLELMNEVGERVKAETQVKQQLAEKEVLLKEIHHRVKNNMQVIISILNLQLSNIKDEKIIRILRDSQARIKTMALVHEKLYETKDFSNIDLLDYIKNLFEFLSSIYKSPNEHIECKITGKPIFINIDHVISLGLITNEIVTNSFKYAFEKNVKGKIEIKIICIDKQTIKYSISDNGKGFPEGFDYRTATSLGLQLVSILTEQIQGTLEVNSSAKGTAFIITFPAKK